MASKVLVLAVLAIACTAAILQSPPAQVTVAVEYAVRAGARREGIARDLQPMRAMGFNAIDARLRWADSEPIRGKYVFDDLNRVLEAAAEAQLRVVVTVDSAPPEWVLRRYSDGRRMPEARSAGPGAAGKSGRIAPQVCFDHPGVRGDLRSFVAAVSSHASRSASVTALDVFGEPPDGFCLCPHTARRVREFAAKGVAAREDFLRFSLRDDLELMTDAARGARSILSHSRVPSILRTAAGEPPQDDWLMSKVVLHYGTSLSADTLARERLPILFDGIAGAGVQRGWWMRADASVPPRERRFAAWAAISRGARMLSYATAPERGTFENVITRNPSLFGQLRPVRSKVAIAFDPREEAGAPGNALAKAHAALFEQNISVDIVHVEELAAIAGGDRYRALVVVSGLAPPASAADAMKPFVAAGGTIVNAADPSLSADRIVQVVTLAGGGPVVRLDGGRGAVETRFLESAEVLMVIGLNHGSSPQKVSMTFAPETQEAIWQNMETGSGVSFVAGPSGPTYQYWFAPKDALVLMIRKRLR